MNLFITVANEEEEEEEDGDGLVHDGGQNGLVSLFVHYQMGIKSALPRTPWPQGEPAGQLWQTGRSAGDWEGLVDGDSGLYTRFLRLWAGVCLVPSSIELCCVCTLMIHFMPILATEFLKRETACIVPRVHHQAPHLYRE